MISTLLEMLASPLMQRSLLVAVMVGLSAPVVGTYLVHRRLAMLGDGIGHISLTGVALGWLVGAALNLSPVDILVVPGAVVLSVLGAVAIEIVKMFGKTTADVALALLFYGGIAGGVLLVSLGGGTTSFLTSYLFGSIATVTQSDVWITLAMTLIILLVGLGLRPALFSVSNDEDFALASGLPVRKLNLLIAIVSALTVAVSMRVVGVLLVSALMIVPVAISQLFTKSFTSTMYVAMGLGLVLCVGGLSLTYAYDLSPGATIVVLAILLYALVAAFVPLGTRLLRRKARSQYD